MRGNHSSPRQEATREQEVTREYVALALICAGALVARVALAAAFPSFLHPDETLQYLEQAYRVVTGQGLIPWEYRFGVRSWIIPGMVVPPIALAHALGASPQATSLTVAFASSLASLAVVVSAFVLGRRGAGPMGGITASLLVAFWPETALASSHVLADTASAIPLIVALAVAYRSAPSSTQLCLAGFFLAFASLLRPQLAPAAGLVGLLISGWQLRSLLGLAVGVVLAAALYGLVDWLTWGSAFSSLIGYVKVNTFGVASSFGTEPFYQYAGQEVLVWNWAMLLGLATALMGARRMPIVAIAAVAVLLTFSLIPHKENRFIYPAIPLVLTLCGIGSAEAIRCLRLRYPNFSPPLLVSSVAALWAAAAMTAYAGPSFQRKLHSNSEVLAAINDINGDPSVCGVALDPQAKWFLTGASRFRRDIPLYAMPGEPLARDEAFNAILKIGADPQTAYGDFSLLQCHPGENASCAFVRKSPCVAHAGKALTAPEAPAVTAVLRSLNIR